MGRPKKARGLLPQLREELASKITIREGGKELTITRFQAIIKRLVSDTMNGKSAQMRLIVEMMRIMDKESSDEIHLERELSRADAELLREMMGGLSNE